MQNDETAPAFMSGLRDYYNFVRPHMGIEGQTPAEAAGIDLELGRNRMKNLIRQSAVELSSPASNNFTKCHSNIY
jgi:hypothetical protein